MSADPPAQAPPTPAAREKLAVIAMRRALRWIEPWYISYAILGALVYGVAVILVPVVIIDHGGSATEIGTAIAVQNFGMLFAPFWGWLSDRFKDYRTVFFSGFVMLSAGFALFGLFKGPLVWHAAAFLIGFGAGASNTVASLFVVEFTAEAEWGKRISWLQTFNAIGVILGTAGAGLLRPKLGLAVAAFLAVPALVIGVWGLPIPGGRNQHRLKRISPALLANLVRSVEPAATSVMDRLYRLRLLDIKTVHGLFISPFGTLLAGWFLFSLGVSSFSSLYPVLMRSEFRLAVVHSSLLLSVATALSIPLYNVAGHMTARRGAASVLGIGIAVRLIALAGLGLLGIFHAPFAVLPAILLFASFQGIWPLISVASNNLAAEIAPFGKGTAMGLFNAAAAIASGAGAIAGGAMADHFGFPSVSLFAAAIIAAALGCALRLREPAQV